MSFVLNINYFILQIHYLSQYGKCLCRRFRLSALVGNQIKEIASERKRIQGTWRLPDHKNKEDQHQR